VCQQSSGGSKVAVDDCAVELEGLTGMAQHVFDFGVVAGNAFGGLCPQVG
jgi:hypothetical protein